MGRVIAMPLPRLGETMEEGRIGLILKQPGQAFKRGETLLEVESDKTTVEVPALQDGILVEWLVASDQMVPVESAIARIEIEGEAVSEAKPPANSAAPQSPHPERSSPIPPPLPVPQLDKGPSMRPRASTAARAAARRSGIDLSGIGGTGRNGRISRADVLAASRPLRATALVDTPQGKVFVRSWPAQGQPRGDVLLIHGLFADSQSFTTLGRKLAARGFRTYAVDLPGHGETQSPATSLDDISAAVAASLPPVKFHIIGHSFGAIIATRLIAQAASLTLLSPAGCGEDINGEFIAAMLGNHIDHAIGFLGETVPPEAQAALADHLSVNGGQLRSIAGAVAEGGKQTVSILGALSRAAIPVTAVFLRDDPVIPAAQSLDMPFNVTVRIMPGASHLPHWRNPDAVAALV